MAGPKEQADLHARAIRDWLDTRISDVQGALGALDGSSDSIYVVVDGLEGGQASALSRLVSIADAAGSLYAAVDGLEAGNVSILGAVDGLEALSTSMFGIAQLLGGRDATYTLTRNASNYITRIDVFVGGVSLNRTFARDGNNYLMGIGPWNV